MKTNYFRCPHCKKFTRHIEITTREACAIAGFNPVINTTLGVLGDFFSLRHVSREITGEVPYKCGDCGRCAWRSSSGEEKNFIGYCE